MRIIERINHLENVLKNVKDPALLFVAKKSLDELKNDLNNIKKLYHGIN